MVTETLKLDEIKNTLGLNEEDFLVFRKMVALPYFMNSTFDNVKDELQKTDIYSVLDIARNENWLINVEISNNFSLGNTGGTVETFMQDFRNLILDSITTDEMIYILDYIITENEVSGFSDSFQDLVTHALISYARALKYILEEKPLSKSASVSDYVGVLQTAIMTIGGMEVSAFLNKDDKKIMIGFFNGAKLYQ